VALPIRYFQSVFGRYFSVFTIPIPKKNSVGTFRYQKGGSAPFFLKRGAMAPFLRASTPFWKKRGEERGEVYKKGGIDTDRNTENPANLIPLNTDTEKTAGNTAIQL